MFCFSFCRLAMIQLTLLTISPSLDQCLALQQAVTQISAWAAMSMYPAAGPSGQTMDQEAALFMVSQTQRVIYYYCVLFAIPMQCLSVIKQNSAMPKKVTWTQPDVGLLECYEAWRCCFSACGLHPNSTRLYREHVTFFPFNMSE